MDSAAFAQVVRSKLFVTFKFVISIKLELETYIIDPKDSAEPPVFPFTIKLRKFTVSGSSVIKNPEFCR
jgi:hypothetical protein